jgi:hypothetical protein
VSASLFLNAHCRSRGFLCLCDAPLFEKDTGASFINVRGGSRVSQTLEDAPRTV